jgi:hypothetical protein
MDLIYQLGVRRPQRGFAVLGTVPTLERAQQLADIECRSLACDAQDAWEEESVPPGGAALRWVRHTSCGDYVIEQLVGGD